MRLVGDEAQCGDGYHVVEAGVGEGQRSGIASDPVECGVAMHACVIQPRPIDIEPGDRQSGRGEAACEPAGAATDIKQSRACRSRELSCGEIEFAVADPAATRRVVPGVVQHGVHGGMIGDKAETLRWHRTC